MNDMILVKDLPDELVQSALQDIANYTIGFLRVVEGPGACDAHLLGSGVLVSTGGKNAIVTADHVVSVFPVDGRVGFILGRTTQPYTVDVSAMAPVRIKRGNIASDGPDLAALILAPNIAASISAKKSFFNVDMRRQRMLNDPPDLHDGAWFSNGFLQEGTKVTPDPIEDGLTKYFYNFTGVGGPDSVDTVDGFDYFDFPVSHTGRAVAPVDWGGMSGGGIWQVQFKRNGDRLTHVAPVLAGIAFYQHPTSETVCGIRAHGRRSIYENLVRAIHEP